MLSACSSNINVNTNYDYDSLAKQFSLDNINEVSYLKQNELVYNNLVRYYSENNYDKLDKVLPIINGESKISLRIMDWFTTNYAKKNYTIYTG